MQGRKRARSPDRNDGHQKKPPPAPGARRGQQPQPLPNTASSHAAPVAHGALLNARQYEEERVRRANNTFSKIPGALVFPMASQLRSLLQLRANLIDVAQEFQNPNGWESVSCRLMYQEGRLMSYEGKAGHEVTGQCRQPHPLTWMILNVLGKVSSTAPIPFEKLQITFNKYHHTQYCPVHRDWKGLINITYLIWGGTGVFSFHATDPPHGIVQEATLRDAILYLSGPSRTMYMHGVSGVRGAARYSMRIAQVDDRVHDIQQKKRQVFVELAKAEAVTIKRKWCTLGDNVQKQAQERLQLKQLRGNRRFKITKEKNVSAERSQFERAGILHALCRSLEIVEKRLADAAPQHLELIHNIYDAHTDLEFPTLSTELLGNHLEAVHATLSEAVELPPLPEGEEEGEAGDDRPTPFPLTEADMIELEEQLAVGRTFVNGTEKVEEEPEDEDEEEVEVEEEEEEAEEEREMVEPGEVVDAMEVTEEVPPGEGVVMDSKQPPEEDPPAEGDNTWGVDL